MYVCCNVITITTLKLNVLNTMARPSSKVLPCPSLDWSTRSTTCIEDNLNWRIAYLKIEINYFDYYQFIRLNLLVIVIFNIYFPLN